MKQGGAEVARLAHNQKVAGSNPAPATNSASATLFAPKLVDWTAPRRSTSALSMALE
jgi:hypothetical protein